ncbi:MAG: flagellar FliJ family protein [Phycisphaerales bacterium]
MKRFQFKLDPVLRMRQHEERAAQAAVAEVARECEKLRAQLQRLQMQLASDQQGMRAAVSGRVDIDSLRASSAAHLDGRRRAEVIVRHLADAERRLQTAQHHLQACTARRRALEQLREARMDDWHADRLREEQIVLDDLASLRAMEQEQPS